MRAPGHDDGVDAGELPGRRADHFIKTESEWLSPDVQCAGLGENQLPVAEAQRDEMTVIVEVDKGLTLGFVLLSSQIRQLVVTVEMHGPLIRGTNLSSMGKALRLLGKLGTL
jgi:hypothetical protein